MAWSDPAEETPPPPEEKKEEPKEAPLSKELEEELNRGTGDAVDQENSNRNFCFANVI